MQYTTKRSICPDAPYIVCINEVASEISFIWQHIVLTCGHQSRNGKVLRLRDHCCDLRTTVFIENNESWLHTFVNGLPCDLRNVVAYGNNKMWQPKTVNVSL